MSLEVFRKEEIIHAMQGTKESDTDPGQFVFASLRIRIDVPGVDPVLDLSKVDQKPTPAMHVHLFFYGDVRLVELMAPDRTFVPDKNTFSGLDCFSREGHSEYLPALNDIEGSVGN
jgi:hypothetical protein